MSRGACKTWPPLKWQTTGCFSGNQWFFIVAPGALTATNSGLSIPGDFRSLTLESMAWSKRTLIRSEIELQEATRELVVAHAVLRWRWKAREYRHEQCADAVLETALDR
jgi:hypothetical protein